MSLGSRIVTIHGASSMIEIELKGAASMPIGDAKPHRERDAMAWRRVICAEDFRGSEAGPDITPGEPVVVRDVGAAGSGRI
jgi:hypothetical protein